MQQAEETLRGLLCDPRRQRLAHAVSQTVQQVGHTQNGDIVKVARTVRKAEARLQRDVTRQDTLAVHEWLNGTGQDAKARVAFVRCQALQSIRFASCPTRVPMGQFFSTCARTRLVQLAHAASRQILEHLMWQRRRRPCGRAYTRRYWMQTALRSWRRPHNARESLVAMTSDCACVPPQGADFLWSATAS